MQFVGKMQAARHAGVDSYTYYVAERITGFASHWNTFSAQEMFALVMLVAMLLFGIRVPKRWVWCICGVLIAVVLYLGQTRAVWIATVLAGLYLVWFWKKWLAALVPAAKTLSGILRVRWRRPTQLALDQITHAGILRRPGTTRFRWLAHANIEPKTV